MRAAGVPGHAEAVDLLLQVAKEPPYSEGGSYRMDVAISLCRIATDRSRHEAVDLVPTIQDEVSRQELRNKLSAMFEQQRLASRNPAEIASIDEVLARLK